MSAVIGWINWLVKRFLDPVALFALLLLIASVVLWRRRRKIEAATIIGVALGLCVVFGTSLTSRLLATLEQPFYRASPSAVSEANVVVVLGGIVMAGQGEVHGFDAYSSFDRLLAGIELVRLGKAPMLLLGGGGLGYPEETSTEFSALEPWLDSFDLPEVTIQHIGLKSNTHEEALAVKAMAEEEGWERIILVTSASHMRRALGVFRSTGLTVDPAACDFRTQPPGLNHFIPKVSNVQNLKIYFYERLGWYIYRLRGWITEDHVN